LGASPSSLAVLFRPEGAGLPQLVGLVPVLPVLDPPLRPEPGPTKERYGTQDTERNSSILQLARQ
jgi:hypothetical protein